MATDKKPTYVAATQPKSPWEVAWRSPCAHGHLVANPGVPRWWPGFCLAFDVVVAAILAWLLYWNVGVPRAVAPSR